jgi:hypothetical protein
VNQQYHRSGEIRIIQALARYQQLADGQILGIPELDRNKNGWGDFAFRTESVGPVWSAWLAATKFFGGTV